MVCQERDPDQIRRTPRIPGPNSDGEDNDDDQDLDDDESEDELEEPEEDPEHEARMARLRAENEE